MRPRYGRLAAFGSSLLVTLVTMLGGLGLLPGGGSPAAASAPAPSRGAITLTAETAHGMQPPERLPAPERRLPSGAADAPSKANLDVPLPEASGTGRRVVFSISDQRVWLVRSNGSVARTYLVSGSVGDNLKPGRYSVYSRSMNAWGIDGTTMRYMVRFAHGVHAAIGFHDIPLMDGERVQKKSQLGMRLSHGCVRQWPDDARAMWRFAPVGTKVVVTA